MLAAANRPISTRPERIRRYAARHRCQPRRRGNAGRIQPFGEAPQRPADRIADRMICADPECSSRNLISGANRLSPANCSSATWETAMSGTSQSRSVWRNEPQERVQHEVAPALPAASRRTRRARVGQGGRQGGSKDCGRSGCSKSARFRLQCSGACCGIPEITTESVNYDVGDAQWMALNDTWRRHEGH